MPDRDHERVQRVKEFGHDGQRGGLHRCNAAIAFLHLFRTLEVFPGGRATPSEDAFLLVRLPLREASADLMIPITKSDWTSKRQMAIVIWCNATI
jgi:hypothetical protein